MELESGKGVDRGRDLRVGDVVWIKGVVTEEATASGDVKVQYLARPGKKEYARPSINAVFLRRSWWNSLRRLGLFRLRGRKPGRVVYFDR